MSALKIDRVGLKITIASFLFLSLFIAVPPAISQTQPCAVSPASGAATVLPNTLIIFDNSLSMAMYAHQDAYDPNETYTGIFESGERYNYNTSGGYFEQAAGGAWSGNFLNWACTLRIDIARKVLTGGKVIDYGGSRYITSNTYSFSTPARAYTDDDDDNHTPYSESDGEHQYDHIVRASSSYEWARLQVTNGTTDTYNIRILVSAGYTATGLLHTLEGKIRLGLMHFNPNDGSGGDYIEGGYVQRPVKKLEGATSGHLHDIVSDLNRDLGYDYNWSFTPLAESLYSAVRYFSQVAPGSYYHAGDYPVGKGTADDPLYQEGHGFAWCARNYVIIVTDGEPTFDRNVPIYDPETGRRILDADPDAVYNCDVQSDGTTKQYCAGGIANCGYETVSCSGYPYENSSAGWGTMFLDDVAYYAAANDLRNDAELPNDQTITTHTIFAFGTTDYGADILLEKAAKAHPDSAKQGIYSMPTNAAQLSNALEQVFDLITEQAAAAASTAITSEPVSGVDLIYIPYFKHPYDNQWYGNIRAFELDADDGNLINDSGSVASDTDGDLVLDDPIWDADAELVTLGANNREIFTTISATKVDFDTSHAATVGPYLDVDLNNNSTEDETAEVEALISYIRGTEDPGGFDLRNRSNHYMGDIMHASPSFVGKPQARYDLIYGDGSYWIFFWNNVSRTPVLYAGANDGMLHCFDATTGEEKWAYIPSNLLPHLKWLPDSYDCHSYYVDLSANVWDLKLGSPTAAWKSVLIGGMRIGGTPINVDTNDDGTQDTLLRSALFALDVTDPDTVFTDPDAVMWEVNNDNFGYTTSMPIPVRVREGGTTAWFLVFGSGPQTRDGEGGDSSDGYTDTQGYIFVVNPEDGTVLRTIDLGAGNFFGSPVAIDYDLDYSVDMIYIGDAKGNLWRLKTFTGSGATKTYYTTPADWIIDVDESTPAVIDPLLSLGTDQPILIKPAISMDEKGRVWIYFGTGRYFCANDNQYCNVGNDCPSSGSCAVTEFTNDRSKFMAVGVYDRHWDTDHFVLQDTTIDLATNPNALDRRAILAGNVVGNLTETGYYVVDYVTGQLATDVDPSTDGWYFHLLEEGERCLGDFLVYRGAVFFISFTPDISDPCIRGGLSNLYGVHYTSGTSTYEPMFDLTGEGDINSNDLVTDGTNTYGPAIIRLDKGFAGGSPKIKDDNLYTPLPDKPQPINPPGDDSTTGVTSWREVLQ